MARNSRFRTTSGPSSSRPRVDKKKGFKKGDDGDRKSSYRKEARPFDRKPPINKEGGTSRPLPNRTNREDFRHDGPREKKGDFVPRGSRPFSKGDFTKRKEGEASPEKRADQPRDERRGGPDASERTYRKGPGSESRGGDTRKEPRQDGLREERGSKSFSRDGSGRGSSDKKKCFVDSRLDRQRTRVSGKQEPSSPTPSDGLIRLNKFISNSGVCSRREADDLITAGLITVNGKSITEMGHKVKATDDVRYEGKRLKSEAPVYILLNKPKGYITTTDDPQERNTVMQLIHGACKERVYPVGRLDRNTSGLLLLTNDGDLTDKLTHPSYNVKKIYKAELDKPLTKNDFQKIREGVHLEEGKAVVDDLAIVSEDGKTVGIEIHIGWNRLIRRIFESLDYEVVKLDRSVYATLDKKDLSRGHWRFLRQDEIVRLKHFK